MDEYNHSVTLDKNKCTGCTTCIKHCPTEAIRVIDGIATINSYRCIDCGQCIRICPNNAKKAVYDKLNELKGCKWKIALPAPTLYGQFEELDDVNYVLQGLLDIGFDDVFEVAKAAELVTAYTRRYLNFDGIKKPVISSACPVVTRLISLRFPTLVDHIVPMLPPMEVAARLAKERALEEHPDLKPEEIKTFFISPCPAKASYVKNGFGSYESQVDEVLSISDIYFQLLSVMKRDRIPLPLSDSGKIGIIWAQSGGESSGLFMDKYLAADGIENVISVLEQLENGNFPSIDFVELNACPGGCVGGVMSVENPFIAKARLLSLRKYLPIASNSPEEKDANVVPPEYFFDEFPKYEPMNRLSSSIGESMRMMAEIRKIRDTLPGIDCGACGAPTCRAFAEDVVRGNSNRSDCLVREAYEQAFSEKGD